MNAQSRIEECISSVLDYDSDEDPPPELELPFELPQEPTDVIVQNTNVCLSTADIEAGWSTESSTSGPPWFPPDQNTKIGGPAPVLRSYSPYQLYKLFMDTEIIEQILEQTNLFASSSGSEFRLDERTLDRLVGVGIYSGLHRYNNIDDHFLDDPFHQSFVNKVMSRSEFFETKRYLHFQNNANYVPRGSVGFDAYSKIRPLHSMLMEKFKLLYSLGPAVSIDELMNPYRGRTALLQYIKTKHHRFGVKHYVLADTEGYIWDTIPHADYEGPLDLKYADSLPSERWVLKLMDGLAPGHTVVTDRYYTSPALFMKLRSLGHGAMGTVMTNRKGLPSVVKNFVRVDTPYFYRKDGLLLACWYDGSNFVPMLSTVHDASLAKTKRGDKDAFLKFRVVTKPTLAHDYNGTMNGVDLADQCMTHYKTYPHRHSKWYHEEFFRFLDMILHNAFIIYRSFPENRMTGEQFRQAIVTQLWNDVFTSDGYNLSKLNL